MFLELVTNYRRATFSDAVAVQVDGNVHNSPENAIDAGLYDRANHNHAVKLLSFYGNKERIENFCRENGIPRR